VTSGHITLEDDFELILEVLGDFGERISIVLESQSALWARQESSWAVLPSLRKEEIFWVLIASDTEAERRGREIVTAFIVPSLGRIVPGVTIETFRNSNESTSNLNKCRALQIDRIGSLSEFVDALELLVSVRTSEPNVQRKIEDPIGFLLRDLYLAIDSRDPVGSFQLLERVKETGILSSDNLRFLRIERLAKLGYWQEMRSLPWFIDITRVRKPLRISDHLLEAVWRTEFDEAEVSAKPELAAIRFEERKINDIFRSLLQSIDIPSTIQGRRLVTLATHLGGNIDRVNRIIEKAGESEVHVLRLLGGLESLPSIETSSQELEEPIVIARSRFDQGDHVDVIVLAEEHSTDPRIIALAIRSSYELNDPKMAERASVLAKSIDDQSFPDSREFRKVLEEVQYLATNQCHSWAAWFHRLAKDESWGDAPEIARELSGSWSVDEFLTVSVVENCANSLVQASEGINSKEVRASLDLICDLAAILVDRDVCESFVDSVLLVLSSDENPSPQVRNAFHRLLSEALRTGPSVDRYRDLVSSASDLWQRVRARETVSWALDVADSFAATPCPDVDSRWKFISALDIGVRDFASRMPSDERVLLETIANECGTSVSLPPQEKDIGKVDIWSSLNGKVVAIYSLLDNVGSRFAERLHRLCPDVQVEYNQDKVATSALRTLATSADFLIVDTRHASHAATGAIDSSRPRSEQLFPTGGGVSSFIACLREAIINEGN
jgi:hypothetical protein